jgi:hypothetical protein
MILPLAMYQIQKKNNLSSALFTKRLLKRDQSRVWTA